MSATLRIDALKFVRKLTEAGMERPVAEAIVEGIAAADMSDLATRSDLVGLKSELKAEMAELKSELFRFMLVQSIGIVGLTVTLIKLLP
jgi:hypothetical protein